ncbi:hypothetical protein [Streptomyces sp. NPDC018352]|uniref:hypothetical protein n=1 Tax=Streptomyces sp. NPDC018352 TaxID=3157194 RepID=UPI0033E88E8E
MTTDASKSSQQTSAAAAVDNAMAEWAKLPGNATTLESWRSRQAQRVGKGIGFDPRKDLLPLKVRVDGLGSSLGRK